MQTANIEFLRQFREETITLPKKQRRLIFRPSSGTRKDGYLLDRMVEEQITQPGLIRSLIAKIEREDLTIGRRTSEYIKKMLASFTGFARMDPSSTHYFIRLSAEIRQFVDWIDSYRNETETPLLSSLKCIASKKHNPRGIQHFCCRDIDNTETAVQLFSDGLCHYYEILCHYFELESEASGTTMVVSQAGRSLYTLLILIGRQIETTGSTIERLRTWKHQSHITEIQEIYN